MPFHFIWVTHKHTLRCPWANHCLPALLLSKIHTLYPNTLWWLNLTSLPSYKALGATLSTAFDGHFSIFVMQWSQHQPRVLLWSWIQPLGTSCPMFGSSLSHPILLRCSEYHKLLWHTVLTKVLSEFPTPLSLCNIFTLALWMLLTMHPSVQVESV